MIPVVNAVRKRDETLDADIDTLVGHVRKAAPASAIVAPVIIDDFEVDGRDEDNVGAGRGRDGCWPVDGRNRELLGR